MSRDETRVELVRRTRAAQGGGGPERIARQHADGKLTARERLDLLLDPGSFVELDRLRTRPSADGVPPADAIPGDAVVTGHGRVDGRPVFVFAQDFTVQGGSLSAAVAAKICKVADLALKVGAPVVGLQDSGGARIQEGIASLAGYGDIFLRNVMASGVVPQLSVILGPCAGGAVYSPALTDFVFMSRTAGFMFITGPEVVRTVTHEDVTKEDLGGADAHARRSGAAHFVGEDDADTLALVRDLLAFLPGNHLDDPPAVPCDDDPTRPTPEVAALVPDDPTQPYDMQALVGAVVDDGYVLPVHAAFAPNVLCGFARLGGRPVGVVANQPAVLAGVLDIDASSKAARFVRFCDCFNLPLVTFVDVPGFLPGTRQEWGGIIRHGAKLLYAYCEATVPKLTVIVRKAYGGAYIVMSSKHLRSDLTFAFPTAEIAVMGPEAAVDLLHRKALADASDPVGERRRLEAEYRRSAAGPFAAAEHGWVDEVIEPEATRAKLIQALAMLAGKRDRNPPRKHGNIPL